MFRYNYKNNYATLESHLPCFLECVPKSSSEMCVQQKNRKTVGWRERLPAENLIFILQGIHVTKLIKLQFGDDLVQLSRSMLFKSKVSLCTVYILASGVGSSWWKPQREHSGTSPDNNLTWKKMECLLSIGKARAGKREEAPSWEIPGTTDHSPLYRSYIQLLLLTAFTAPEGKPCYLSFSGHSLWWEKQLYESQTLH